MTLSVPATAGLMLFGLWIKVPVPKQLIIKTSSSVHNSPSCGIVLTSKLWIGRFKKGESWISYYLQDAFNILLNRTRRWKNETCKQVDDSMSHSHACVKK